MQQKIEDHDPVPDLFFEVIVTKTGDRLLQVDQVQVMGGNTAGPALSGEITNIGLAADQTLPIIRTPKNFINQEEQRRALCLQAIE